MLPRATDGAIFASPENPKDCGWVAMVTARVTEGFSSMPNGNTESGLQLGIRDWGLGARATLGTRG